MTIATARFYYYPRRENLKRYLSMTHWGFAEWFKQRLWLIRDELRGPEANGVDIVNILLREEPPHVSRPNEWLQLLNTFNDAFVCDLSPLRDAPPIENIEKLMSFGAAVAAQAPWPQVRAVGRVMGEPLSDADRATLQPHLAWPRESFFRAMGYAGERLEIAMRDAREEAREPMRQARYLERSR